MRQRKIPEANIAITHNMNEGLAITDGLDKINAGNIIGENDTVVITPNWVQQKPPATGVVVGQESLRQLIRYVKARNPKRIIVATGSGERSTIDIMKAIGFDAVIQQEQVEFIDLNTGPFTRIPLNHPTPASTNMNTIWNEMTILISFAQLKIHQEATLSAAIKNIALGWPPAEEHGFPKMNQGIHNDLHGFIRAMAEKIPIDLSIVSASPAMVGTGPAGGIPVHTGLVICGTDPVATDTVSARMIGLKPQGVGYLYECINRKLGEGDVNKINFTGIPLTEAEMIFSQAAYGQKIAVDA